MHIGEWQHSGLKFCGLSLAGVRTSLTMPEFSLSFDVAQGLPHSIGMKHFLITHGHLDHAAGIPYIISQKAMHNHPPPIFYMPPSLIDPLIDIMNIWQRIEGHTYKYEFKSLSDKTDTEIKPNISIKPFKTVHRVPSQGYSVYRKYKKLKAEYKNFKQQEIVDLYRQGLNPNQESLECLVSFSGDTQIEFLDLNPELKNSKILILEATYLDEKKSAKSAKEWGHTHLDELIPHLESIKSEKIVLIHTSSRYSFKEAENIIAKKIPSQHIDRIVLYPGR